MAYKNLLIFVNYLIVTASLSAQVETVVFDYELSTFNENRPLPAETATIISGSVPRHVDMVELKIYTHEGNEHRAPLYQANWKSPSAAASKEVFRVFLNYKLTASKKYDLEINYFKNIDESERQEIYRQISSSLDNYIDQAFEKKNNRLKILDFGHKGVQL